MLKHNSHTFCVAPMMDWTDRYCRVFHRMLTKHALLYTEMVTADAVLHGNRDRLLGFDDHEQPVALQLGGSDPKRLAEAAVIGEDFGYREINLNVGCPSDRVQHGRFGACLMAEPHLVADCVAAMRDAVNVPVTVKCRIGIDDQDTEEDLQNFIARVSNAGCEIFIIHARKAWLQGLSPKQNRDIPPLNYDRVYRIKSDFPDLTIVINGGIQNLLEARHHLQFVDGVMLGRAAYQTPSLLMDVDQQVFGAIPQCKSIEEVILDMLPFIESKLKDGMRLHQFTRHMVGLFQGRVGARRWRQVLSEEAVKVNAGPEVLSKALEHVCPNISETTPSLKTPQLAEQD